MISIAPATEKDIDFILRANREINRENGVEKSSQLNAKIVRRDILGTDPVAFTDIAYFSDKTVGMVLYGFVYFANSGRLLWVSNLYTDPEHRGQGIAKTLLSHLKAKYDMPVFWATMEQNSAANAIFQKLGAQKFDDIKVYGMMS